MILNFTLFESLDDKIDDIKNGNNVILYHGTNRKFESFDLKYNRQWRSDKFYGNGISLSPDEDTAARYASANANKELPLDIIEKAKITSIVLYKFMHDLYYKGNVTWEQFRKSGKYKWFEKNKIDANDVAELVNLIPGSQSYKDYHEEDDSNSTYDDFNFFTQTSSSLDVYQIQLLYDLGLGDFRERVYTVELTPNDSILISNDVNEIKNSKADITIIYDVPHLLEDVYEVNVKNVDLLKIIDENIFIYDSLNIH